MLRALHDRIVAVACMATEALCRAGLIARAGRATAVGPDNLSALRPPQRRLDHARAAAQARRAIAGAGGKRTNAKDEAKASADAPT